MVLGETGKNFAAGMSGGMAYIYNPEQKFEESVNMEMIDLDPLSEDDFDTLRELIRGHFNYTSSKIALDILNDWEQEKMQFVKVMPRDYKAALGKKKMMEKEEMSELAEVVAA